MILWLLLISSLDSQLPPPDKAAHFGVSASINLACYESVKTLTDAKLASLIGCSVASWSIGVLKEVADANTRGNTFSGGDLLADSIGVAFSASFLYLDF